MNQVATIYAQILAAGQGGFPRLPRCHRCQNLDGATVRVYHDWPAGGSVWAIPSASMMDVHFGQVYLLCLRSPEFSSITDEATRWLIVYCMDQMFFGSTFAHPQLRGLARTRLLGAPTAGSDRLTHGMPAPAPTPRGV